MRLQFAKNHAWLLTAIAAVAWIPMLGSFAVGRGVPPVFGQFPPAVSGAVKPGFNAIVFGVMALGALAVTVFVLAPQLFGFKERGSRQRDANGSFPWWFWVGLTVMAISWYAHWFSDSHLVIYSFVPLWWGFIFAVDGWVYQRTGGRSLVATTPERFLVISVVSIPAWAFFEFLNWYAMEFWVYPRDQFFSHLGQQLWYLLSFSVVLPAVFEWYTLLHTFDGLWNRFSKGPAIQIKRRSTGIVFGIGLVAMFAFGAYPLQLFILLWVGPPLVLSAALAGLGFWTPFRPISRGVWSHSVIAGLASVVNGVFWELWNYGSEYFRGGAAHSLNPNYWFYEIPYVNVLHPFSRMPLLGYFGYLPFGGLAWVCWLVAAHLLDLNPDFDLTRIVPDVEPRAHAEKLEPATSP